jgi:hypothetical protein
MRVHILSRIPCEGSNIPLPLVFVPYPTLPLAQYLNKKDHWPSHVMSVDDIPQVPILAVWFDGEEFEADGVGEHLDPAELDDLVLVW